MNKAAEKTSQQFESVFVSPMRSYTLAALNYYEQLVGAQMDAARAYSDMTIAQARTWLDVKDADSFKKEWRCAEAGAIRPAELRFAGRARQACPRARARPGGERPAPTEMLPAKTRA